MNKLYPFAGSNVSLGLQPSQMSIEEFYEDIEEGIEYKIDGKGNVEVDPNQMALDVVEGEEEEPTSDTKLQLVK